MFNILPDYFPRMVFFAIRRRCLEIKAREILNVHRFITVGHRADRAGRVDLVLEQQPQQGISVAAIGKDDEAVAVLIDDDAVGFSFDEEIKLRIYIEI